MIISSKENRIYKELSKLKTKKYRDKLNKFIIEGSKIFNDFKSNLNIDYIIVKENYNFNIDSNFKKYVLSNELFKNISSQENSQGLIMVCNKKEKDINNIVGDVYILDNIQDPGNLGTIIRTLSAFGIKNLILTNNSVDEYSEKVLRASMGAIFNINIYRLDYSSIIDFLVSKCYNVLITALDENSISIDKMKLQKNNAFIFGNEGNGVSDLLKNITNSQKVIIPIEKNTESLNIAISLAIFAYEISKNKD